MKSKNFSKGFLGPTFSQHSAAPRFQKVDKNSSRGFLGPIGDDLPSLIPLVFALIMFFYAFTFAWNVFDSKNTAFNDNLAILELASVLRANSYVAGHEQFLESCSKAQSIKRIKFRAGLIGLSVNPLTPAPDAEHFEGFENVLDGIFYEQIEDALEFQCENTDESLPDRYNVRFFPLALQREYCLDPSLANPENNPITTAACDALAIAGHPIERKFFVKPMLLVVISWD